MLRNGDDSMNWRPSRGDFSVCSGGGLHMLEIWVQDRLPTSTLYDSSS